jgi:hypothetical protein
MAARGRRAGSVQTLKNSHSLICVKSNKMRTALLFLILFFLSWPLEGVHRPAVQPEAIAIEASNFTIGEFVSLSGKEFKKQLGRRMKFKETIGFFLFKKALKRAMKKDPHLADQPLGEYIMSNLNRNAEASRTGATPQRPKVDPMALASFTLPLIAWGIQAIIGLVSLLTLASVLLVVY